MKNQTEKSVIPKKGLSKFLMVTDKPASSAFLFPFPLKTYYSHKYLKLECYVEIEIDYESFNADKIEWGAAMSKTGKELGNRIHNLTNQKNRKIFSLGSL